MLFVVKIPISGISSAIFSSIYIPVVTIPEGIVKGPLISLLKIRYFFIVSEVLIYLHLIFLLSDFKSLSIKNHLCSGGFSFPPCEEKCPLLFKKIGNPYSKPIILRGRWDLNPRPSP
jgi:hypothetical protein